MQRNRNTKNASKEYQNIKISKYHVSNFKYQMRFGNIAKKKKLSEKEKRNTEYETLKQSETVTQKLMNSGENQPSALSPPIPALIIAT